LGVERQQHYNNTTTPPPHDLQITSNYRFRVASRLEVI
jgi:hypothetical protein